MQKSDTLYRILFIQIFIKYTIFNILGGVKYGLFYEKQNLFCILDIVWIQYGQIRTATLGIRWAAHLKQPTTLKKNKS